VRKTTDKKGPVSRLNDATGHAVRFFRAYTEGVSQRDLTQLFDREATHAVHVLAGSQADEADHRRPMRMLKLLGAFVGGLAFKLSPPRRMLFAAALLLPLLGLFDVEWRVGATRIELDFSPLWFLLALAGMTLLLALELVDRLRVRDELEVARALQHELLPQAAPEFAGWSIAHSTRTANEIGGDYHDFVPLSDQRLALAVGDASGHGIGAGLVMAIASATFRSALDKDPYPRTALEDLNRVLCQTGGRRAFMTFFYGLLEPQSGALTFAIAGHPFPLLRRASGGLEELGRGGLPLGLKLGVEIHQGHTTLAPGDLLVLYSDGLPESVPGISGEAFGFEKLAELAAAGGTAEATHQRIVTAVHNHLGDEPMLDDMTLVVIARAPG